MNSIIRCIAAVSEETLGENELSDIMHLTLGVGENKVFQLCLSDPVEMRSSLCLNSLVKKKNLFIEPQEITNTTYPNEGSAFWDRNELWLSMFTRHIKDLFVIEIEIEIKEE